MRREKESGIRISLSGDAPPETAVLLADGGIEIVAPHDSAAAGLAIDFQPTSGPPNSRGEWMTVRSWAPQANLPSANFAAANAIEAASFILWQASGAAAPMLTGDRRTYVAIARAMTAAPLRVPILVEGEIGTGKQLLVRLVHGLRGEGGALVSVNCSVSDSVFRFAPYEDGSEIGTLFLDNIDELSESAQSIALDSIRARAAAQASDPAAGRSSGVRYAATTRRPLSRMVRQGVFSRELFRELARVAVFIPPLRERRGDIALLANHFLGLCAPGLTFTPRALEALSQYPFPGNVRELENLVRRLAIVPLLGGGGVIDEGDARNQIIVAARQKAEQGKANWRACLEAADREITLRTIAACAGDCHAAARRLGITLRKLRRRVEKTGATHPAGVPPRS